MIGLELVFDIPVLRVTLVKGRELGEPHAGRTPSQPLSLLFWGVLPGPLIFSSVLIFNVRLGKSLPWMICVDLRLCFLVPTSVPTNALVSNTGRESERNIPRCARL
jgi:hypothetical protein